MLPILIRFFEEGRMLPIANPEVVFKQLTDGAVLFSVQDEVYFGLNAVGARVWAALPPVSATWDELYAVLQAEYPEVEPETLRADVARLIEELVTQNLLVPACRGASFAG